MARARRHTIVILALIAAAAPGPRAQGGAPAAGTQKPAEPVQELPEDARAFNAAAGEKNPAKRVEALERFIADHPQSLQLVNMARNQITAGATAAFKDSRAKYLSLAETALADARARADGPPIYSTYNNLASRLLAAGIYSEEAEDFARKGLAAMDERAYMDTRRKQHERSLAAYEKAAATASGSQPAAPSPAEPGAPPARSYRFATKDGIMQASLAPPAPPRSATSVRPVMPDDDEMRADFKSDRVSALATLGQILVKRGKAEEGERALMEAYAARPPSSTMASIARVLADSARKAGNEDVLLEYLTVLALSGRMTTDEAKELDAAYRKTHGGSLDGLEAMLDDRYRRDHVGFAVTPYARAPQAKPTGRTVLAEIFPGAG